MSCPLNCGTGCTRPHACQHPGNPHRDDSTALPWHHEAQAALTFFHWGETFRFRLKQLGWTLQRTEGAP